MVLAEQEAMLRGWDVQLLATDIDSNVLAQAAAGVYPVSRLDGLPASRLKQFFQKGKGTQQGKARVREELRRKIQFDQLNLMQPLDIERQDIVFCRNVIIYFDKPTKTMLMNRFADVLADDGYLIIGHSESLYQVTDRFELIGQTVYRKKR